MQFFATLPKTFGDCRAGKLQANWLSLKCIHILGFLLLVGLPLGALAYVLFGITFQALHKLLLIKDSRCNDTYLRRKSADVGSPIHLKKRNTWGLSPEGLRSALRWGIHGKYLPQLVNVSSSGRGCKAWRFCSMWTTMRTKLWWGVSGFTNALRIIFHVGPQWIWSQW